VPRGNDFRRREPGGEQPRGEVAVWLLTATTSTAVPFPDSAITTPQRSSPAGVRSGKPDSARRASNLDNPLSLDNRRSVGIHSAKLSTIRR
jgi:hypothetical protein